jgi:hypothetical protein
MWSKDKAVTDNPKPPVVAAVQEIFIGLDPITKQIG